MSKERIKFYESSETAPFKNYQKFNKFLALAGEVGESPQDMFARIDRAQKYLKHNDVKNAQVELSNLRLTINNAINARDFAVRRSRRAKREIAIMPTHLRRPPH